MVYSPHADHPHHVKKSNQKKVSPFDKLLYFTFPLIFLFGLGMGYLLWGRDAVTPQSNTIQDIDSTPVRYPVEDDDDPYIGNKDAPVTIIMFSDYQCPACQNWYSEVFQPLIQNYQGKIRFVYRDFPLYTIHSSAMLTAEAANCAGDQGKYWDFFNAVFSGTDSLSDATIQKYANLINLDIDQFNQCLSSHKYLEEVEDDYSYAINFGIQSTPTFFINGIPVIGAQPYSVFKSLIDQELLN
jgi:protein-disulfide isomerase